MKIFADDGVPSPIKILGKNLGPAFWYSVSRVSRQ